MTMCPWLAGALLLISSLVQAGEGLGVGAGVYFLAPREVTDAAGRPALAAARPLVLVRRPVGLAWLGERISFEPKLAVLLPRKGREDAMTYAAFAHADLGYGLAHGLRATGGLGVFSEALVSEGRNVENGGNFVTPAGASVGWRFTTNAGLAYALDERLRLDAQAVAHRLLSASARKIRLLLELSYAL